MIERRLSLIDDIRTAALKGMRFRKVVRGDEKAFELYHEEN